MGLRELEPIRNRTVDALEGRRSARAGVVAAAARVENRWWARRFHSGARVLHDRFLEDGRMTLVREVPSYGDSRLASLLQRNG